MELWAEKEHKDYYSLVLMSLQFIIPLAVLIFTYTRIAVVVWGKLFTKNVFTYLLMTALAVEVEK